MKPKKKIAVLLAIIVLGYVAFAVYSYIVRNILKMEYPNGTFLFMTIDQYMDFFNINFMVHERRPYVDYYSSYPPFALLLAWPFSLMADYASYEYPPSDIVYTMPAKISYGLFIGMFTFAIGVMLYLFIKKSNVISNKLLRWIVVIGLIGTAPFLFMIDRGNYLIITIVFCLAFAYFYEDNEYIAAVFLGLAIALKVYPLFLFLLLFIDKRWKSMGISTAIAGGVSIISLPFFYGGIWQNIREFGSALLSFGGGSASEISNVYYCVGLTSLLRLPFVVWNDGKVPEGINIMLIYVLLGTVLTLWSVWNLRKEVVLWKKMLVLFCLMIFLTPNSYMYNLMYLLPTIVLFLLSEEDAKRWMDMVYLLIVGLLLIPKAYYYFQPLYYFISVQPIIDGCLLLIVIFFYNLFDKKTRTRNYNLMKTN